MEKNCMIMAFDDSHVDDSHKSQEEIYIQKAVNAMVDRVSYMRGIKDIDKLSSIILYRITNFSQDCVMVEYFCKDDENNDDEKYNIIFIHAREKDGSLLQKKCIKPRPFQKIYLTGSVENKILILCDCLDIFGDINNLRLNLYNGACGYLKLNNIDSTLKRTYSFDNDKLIITNNFNGKSFNF